MTSQQYHTGQVPSHWADLVRESSDLSQVDNQKDTWNSISMDDPPKCGDFNSNPDSFPLEQVASAEESGREISEEASLVLNPGGASSIRKVSFLGNASGENHPCQKLLTWR